MYQLPQTNHAVADFSHQHRRLFNKWKKDSNSIIVLETKTELELSQLSIKLQEVTKVSEFREPDIDNQLTSIAFVATPEIRKKYLSCLPLAGNKKFQVSDLILEMSSCKQFHNQSVLEHGISVFKYYQDLISTLKTSNSLYNFQLPDWMKEHSKFILENLHNDKIMKQYLLFHDAGKPFCKEIDSDGKQHFPDHCKISESTYIKYFEKGLISDLILHDMDLHLLKPSEVEEWIKNKDSSFIISLLMACYSELYSNADTMNARDSTSFKIKYKNFDKIGKKILNVLIQKI